MRSAILILILLFSAASTFAEAIDPQYLAIMAKDASGAVDSPLAGRYQGSNLLGQTVKAFDELSLPAGPAEGSKYDPSKHYSKLETVQGKVTRTLCRAFRPLVARSLHKLSRCADGERV